jgi:putative sugar O-methyltransferase
LEIGAGYGSLTRLLKNRFPGSHFVLTDLPERLALQAFYLASSFPRAEIVIGDESHVTSHPSETRPDFTLIPTWSVKDIPPGAVDIVINTHSMQEMNSQQIRYYVDNINRIGPRYFYCVNRKEKMIGTETIRHPAELLSNDWGTIHEGDDPFSNRIAETLHERFGANVLVD